MSTKHQTGAERVTPENSLNGEIVIPSCTVEDVDRALFNLFDRDLELQYEKQGETRRVPIVFATGERFALLRRRLPLRDKAGTLILPVISITRSGIEKDVSRGMGTNQQNEIVIKRRISDKDPEYQRLANREGIQNQSDRATSANYISQINGTADGAGALPGTVATRRKVASNTAPPKISNTPEKGIYEIITIPAPRYFLASYEINIWTQYMQQMNDLLTVILSSGHTNQVQTFRIESPKGYYFVAYLTSGISSGNNFDNFSDDERIVRSSFSMEVVGYIINPSYPGSKQSVKRYYSAPSVSFDIVETRGKIDKIHRGGVKSTDPAAFVLSDVMPDDEPSQTTLIQERGVVDGDPYYDTTSIGGTSGGKEGITIAREYVDPVTGLLVKQSLKPLTRNKRSGETVYREQIFTDLGSLVIDQDKES